MRVLVCGGRDWEEEGFVEQTLNRILVARGPFDRLIHGNARGVDRVAGNWARKKGVLEWLFLPDWHRVEASHGHNRNQLMMAMGTPDLVIAFPGGIGTAKMIEQAKERSSLWQYEPAAHCRLANFRFDEKSPRV
jgi:hypothetical protein